jgi:hypothetical protein
MKNFIIAFLLPLVLWSCSEPTEDETANVSTEVKASEGIILQNNTIVYADSAAKIELLRLKDAEIIEYKGGRVGAADYVRITTSDGQTGFVRFFEFALGSEMAVVHSNAPIFDRPDESSNKVSFYSTLEQVKIVEKKGDWINIWASEHRKGWILKKDLIIGQNEFDLVSQYYSIMDKKTAKERREGLAGLMNNPKTQHLKTLLYIIVEDEYIIKGNFEEWNTAQLEQLKNMHKDIHLSENKFEMTIGARQLSDEISTLFNYFLTSPRVSQNNWMDANLKSLWYVNIMGGAYDHIEDSRKSDYLGYWNVDQISNEDKLFATSVILIDRSNSHIKNQWATHKEMIFTTCFPRSYVDNRCDVLVPQLISVYESLEHEDKWSAFSQLFITIQDSAQAVEGYYIDNKLSEIVGYGFWDGSQPVDGQNAWAHGFWYRRNAEGNKDAVITILREIHEHYTPLIQGVHRHEDEMEGC